MSCRLNFLIVCGGVVVQASVGQAAALVGGPMLNPSSEPYQVLKSAYAAAKPGSAQIIDFPTLENLASSDPSMNCVGIDAPDAQNITQYTALTPALVGTVTITTPGSLGDGLILVCKRPLKFCLFL